MTSYGNSALFGWVLHLTMTTNRDNNVPSVFLERLQTSRTFTLASVRCGNIFRSEHSYRWGAIKSRAQGDARHIIP